MRPVRKATTDSDRPFNKSVLEELVFNFGIEDAKTYFVDMEETLDAYVKKLADDVEVAH